jgi:AcrR family transcriptional regulator
MPRKYSMARRRQNSEELRQRIVEATAALHVEKGILATSIQDIAERADVAPNTVYRYFPTYNEAVRACGAHFFQMIPPPSDESVIGVMTDERIASLVAAWFAFYEVAGPAIEIGERAVVMPAVAEQLGDIEKTRKRQIGLALGETDGGTRGLLDALTTRTSWRSLRDSGASPEEAVRVVVGVVVNKAKRQEVRPAIETPAAERN